MKNTEICQKLRRLHTLLILGKRSNNLALAIRRALEIIPTWKEEAEQIIKKSPVRLIFAGYGPKFIKIFEELMNTGKIEMVEKLQPEFDPFFCYLCEIPSIGETMARRMFFERSIHTMDDLRIAYSNNILKKIPAFGESRLKAIEAILLEDSPHDETSIFSNPNTLKTSVDISLPEILSKDQDISEEFPDENLSSEVGKYLEQEDIETCRQTQIHSPVLYKTTYASIPKQVSQGKLPSARIPKIIDKADVSPTLVQKRGVVHTICSHCREFNKLRESNGYYVDKSHLITDLIENGHTVTQYQRPSGFGMSMALSMFKSFFEQDFEPGKTRIDHRDLFDNLRISKSEPRILSEMNRYPVVSLVFESTAENSIRQMIAEQYRSFRWLLESQELETYEKTRFFQVMSENEEINLNLSIRSLTQWIYRITKVPVVCLIDISDNANNSSDNPFKHMLESIWIQNPALSRCIIMTHQVMPLKEVQIVSVHSKTRDEFFGFTELEVRTLLRYFHLEAHYDTLFKWYGQMDISGRDIFIPEGVMRAIQSLQMSGHAVKNEQIWSLYQSPLPPVPLNAHISHDINTLCYHQDPKYTILREIQWGQTEGNIYTTLMDSGLIRASEQLPTSYGTLKCKFMIPNEYARFIWLQWLSHLRKQQIQSDTEHLTSFMDALEFGPANALEYELKWLFSKLPAIYEPEITYYRQVIAETSEYIGFPIVIQNERNEGPDITIIHSEKAIFLSIHLISVEELQKNQLSVFTEPDPDISQTDLKKLHELLESLSQSAGKNQERTRLESQILLKYPEITTFLYYGISICRNQCKVSSL